MWKYAKRILFTACILDIINQNLCDLRACIGPSMMPTFNSHGDIALLERISVRLHKLRQGDIVVALLPHDPDKLICKRLIGLPGDTICIDPTSKNNHMFIQVPAGHVWLQGDNITNSTDSRSYGPIPYGLIRAKVVARVWPLKSMEWIFNGFDAFEKTIVTADNCVQPV
jgi:mitochondrial inner membrane protease subunit 1